MFLTRGQQHELDCHSHFGYLHDNATVIPFIQDVLSRYQHLKSNLHTPSNGFCFGERCTQTVTGFNQWFAYPSKYHVPTAHHEIHELHSTINHDSAGRQMVEFSTISHVTIRFPRPEQTYLDYLSLLIHNNLPMLFGLSTQTRLHTVTDKDPTHQLLTSLPSMFPSHLSSSPNDSITSPPRTHSAFFLLQTSPGLSQHEPRTSWLDPKCSTMRIPYWN